MLRQSSSRNHRSKKLRPSHSLQAFLLVAVGVWVVYQLTRSYGKQHVVAVETDDADGEQARRRLGRKGFVGFAAGQASADDIVGVGGQGADSSDDPSRRAGDGEGGEEDQEADEEDGVESDADDDLAADEEEDDLESQNGSNEDEAELTTANGETEMKTTAHGEIGNGLNTSIVSLVNGTGTVQGGAAVLVLNATGRTEDGTAATLSGSALKNTPSVDLSSLHGGGTDGVQVAGDQFRRRGTWRAENEMLQSNKNGTEDSVAGHGISS